ncbi:hypothetical protein INT46_007648 [Mucor plumbeus]|uniref:SGNH hydrolase-type esterase domain-containing protein n=1 Tax=Mucor plumbeus TaxID=97098 RepID=A0A8H7V3D6_9FUNG|nr:hypothetical protein INT46_007648 [Mucor plumbeus]
MLRLTLSFMSTVGTLSIVSATNVTSLSDCPGLTARTGATSIYNLRINNIKVIYFLGDSFAAEFAAMSANFSSSSTNDNFGENKEYKGISYGIGCDANTLAVHNYINIQIGENDMCSSSNSSTNVTDLFGDYIESAIERTRANIPKVLVKLISSYNTSQFVPLSDKQGIDYCTMTNNDTSNIRNRNLCQCGTTAECHINM